MRFVLCYPNNNIEDIDAWFSYKGRQNFYKTYLHRYINNKLGIRKLHAFEKKDKLETLPFKVFQAFTYH